MSEIVRDRGLWRCVFTVEKYWADDFAALLAGWDARPYGVEQAENLFMNGGVSCLWECLAGNGSGTADTALTYFNATNAAIGSGDSSTAAASTQTDLQASTNRLRVGMNATYPQHSDGTVAGSRDFTLQSTFATSQANWTWNELGVFNSATTGTGRMLNRSVNNYGTKTSASAWLTTAVLTIS